MARRDSQMSIINMLIHLYQLSHLALRLAHLTGSLGQVQCVRHSNVFKCLLSRSGF